MSGVTRPTPSSPAGALDAEGRLEMQGEASGMESSPRPDDAEVTAPEIRQRITVTSAGLGRRQLRHFLVFNLGSAAATVAAILWSHFDGLRLSDFVLFVVFYGLSVIGVEIGFHRCFTHRAFVTSRRMRQLFAILACSAAQGSTVSWVATHRRHHAFAEAEQDPHSPRRGIWHAHMGWLLASEQTYSPTFARDLLVDRSLVAIDRRYMLWVALGVVLPGLINLMIHGEWAAFVSGTLWGGGVRLFLSQQGSMFINSGCHSFGKRSFDTRDDSKNIAFMTIPSLGQSLHNNHHAFPRSATTAFFPGDLDVGGLLVRLLHRLGLVSEVVRPSAAQVLERQIALRARAGHEPSSPIHHYTKVQREHEE
jgi:stearoyl-CoA desaturase (Delta-9 desaturase)